MDKSKYYTSPDNYQDIDGNMKTFNYVDHDVKPTISVHISETEKEKEEREKWMTNQLKERIEEVLQFPAAAIAHSRNENYQQLIFRTEEGIKWNEKAVIDHLTTNRNSFLPNLVWKSIVKEVHWHDPMWIDGDHEAIMRGDWKTLM